VKWSGSGACPVLGCHTNNTEPQLAGKGKGKVVPVLLLTEHHATNAYWESEGLAPLVL
jgi:hypothetical protein